VTVTISGDRRTMKMIWWAANPWAP
jgi:hypothetical protein